MASLADATARQLLQRAFQRVDIVPAATALPAMIAQVVSEVPQRDATMAPFATRVAALAASMFPAEP